MCRERRNRGSEWELDWVRRYDGDQTDQGEVLDDCCHVTSTSEILRSEVTLLQLPFFRTRAPLSVKLSKKNENLVKNLPTR